METLLRARDLDVTFTARGRPAVHAVRGVSLDVGRGEIVGVVGESGSGKTTLGRCLAGFLTPTSGTVAIDADRDAGGRGRPVQMIFQESAMALDPRMPVWRSVAEAISHGRSVRGLYEPAARELERVGIDGDMTRRRPRQLSGGQRQRVAIARAVASGAELIVCDEAVSALDVSVRARVLNLIARVRTELGVSFVFISHDMAVVSHLSDRVAVMRAGRVVEEGPTRGVIDRPSAAYTRALIAAVPQLERG